ncbi:hypothetical protein ACSBOB_20245 [Mesorhizobium sp. ASY16-5R]|uniref:hypothetical protein n=1 Tax=Mesorhizobium sp. ASY16-5R TaxID=3445772 RepID=UPI003F9F7817
MATVTAFLKHTPIGKKTQAEPYTAAAHARYVMRKNAMQFFYSEHMPKNYHAIQRWLIGHEDGLRANGRVQDGFIISVPRSVSREDAAVALKRFGFRIGQGRTPYYFVGHGFDTNNHHVHFEFFDRDVETGRRVFGTSERGSTAKLKIEWETAANDTFEQLGYDVRVKVHEGYQLEAENDNIEASKPETEAASLRPDSSLDLAPESGKSEDFTGDDEMVARALPRLSVGDVDLFVDARLGELRDIENPHFRYDFAGDPLDNYAPELPFDPDDDRQLFRDDLAVALANGPQEIEDGEVEPEFDESGLYGTIQTEGLKPSQMTPLERVQEAKELWEEHRLIQRSIADRDETLRRYEVARQRAEDAAIKAAQGIGVTAAKEQALHNAREQWDATHHASGRAKGLRLSVFGRTLWASKTAKQAAEAETRFVAADRAYDWAKKDLELLNRNTQQLSSEAATLRERAEALEQHVRLMGTDAELAKASEIYQNSIKEHVGEMTLGELVVMVAEGELTPDQCEDILRITGRKHDLEEFLEGERLREDRGASL